MSAEEQNRFTDADRQALREVLAAHDIQLAILFGSALNAPEPADIDLAVEFDTWRPGDDGYASAYLSLHTALEEAVGTTVDLVDIHTADDAFLAVALDTGTYLYGSKQRYAELKNTVSDSHPSTTDAQKRVAAAAQRLREQFC
ncbi:Predicted nucleotidyltransferase [Halovenus aranensis]|uniref:Predicted nucleotidyltransferase n=1 Tax=Halovenus aranensis TaxID=890420 RepID=A0A1G8VVY7_9EURY|nr:nucleotidyltransferase domain-containing protein [Halovenus aranensis]SDJ69967.1 Predicted nucleotidyltransferase [Halovenus aranensis]